MIKRKLLFKLEELLSQYPAVGLLGPRQVGKTTLALEIATKQPSIYLDLESPSDLAKLTDAELYFSLHEDKLIILDEIQRAPEFFRLLRGIIDKGKRKGLHSNRFLILGSASIDLLKQSSETLAGRISYIELTPFDVTEIDERPKAQELLWLRGGFPDSYLALDDVRSFQWRQDFIKTYLERDIPLLGPRIPAETLRRFWVMLASVQGSLLNAARLASSLGVSGQTIMRYIDLMVDLFLVRRLLPWSSNSTKRLVKSPKLYIRDSGILHGLLGIRHFEDLFGHPIAGSSWEGFVIETLITNAPLATETFFYCTSSGAEIDLLMVLPPNRLWAFEIKKTLAPKLERGFYLAAADLKPEKAFVIYPGRERFSISTQIEAIGLKEMVFLLKSLSF